LTVLGIVIGVLVVIVVASILTGMRQNMVAAIEEYGTNNIYAFHLTTGPRLGPRDRAEFKRKPLKVEDGEAIREQAKAVEEVANVAYLWLTDRTMAYGGAKYKEGRVQNVSASYERVVSVCARSRFARADDHTAAA
jgi:putative ABC transport system permease protein